MATVLDIADLTPSNNTVGYRSLPIIVKGYQGASAVAQLQRRIGQCVGNAILSKLRAYNAHNDSLWFASLDLQEC